MSQLESGPGERINFVIGFAPYAPIDHHSRLLASEIDRFYEKLAAQEAEEDEEDNQLIGLLIINLFRGYVRSSVPVEFETSQQS